MAGTVGQHAWARGFWLAVMMGIVLLVASCNPASDAFREGRRAEEQKNYDSAVIDFEQALKTQPENTRYLIFDKDARSKDSLFHLQRGRQLLAQGRTNQAAAEFQRAISVDPGNQAARQELQQIMLKQGAAEQQRERAIRQAMEAQGQSQSTGIVELKALPAGRIARLHVSANSRVVFETLGKLAGINVVFYYNFEDKPVSLDLTNVTILDALKAAADEADVFWKPITSNTILIIPDTLANRNQLEPKVLKTVYLKNPLSEQDRTAILTAVKQVTQVLHAFENPDTNSITVYDTASNVNAAVKLIHSLDRGKAEVLIDVTVLEADMDRLRDLGLAPVPLSGIGTGSTLAAVGFNPATTATTTSTGAVIPPNLGLNQLGSIATRDFSIELPGVIANALLTDTSTHILQSPEIRATAGEKATLHIGQKIPYATGSFGIPTAGASTGAGGASAFGLLANTQFTYADTGVSLTITPYVAADGDVILNTKIDVSSEGQPASIGGLEEPTFNERTITHTIRLKEGEVSLLGGLIQRQTNNITSGLPGLAKIPLLRYFFSTNSVETIDEDVMIMMTPHVIRLPGRMEASAQQPAMPTQPSDAPKAATPHAAAQKQGAAN